MSKHYNLTVTDDNGKSVTTSNTSTEHSEEILRMMHLAGMQDSSCGCEESIEENEYQPTPKNDKLDLDDYSKKSPESISKQPKKLQPSKGDNPLEYSLDENEIFESLMSEMEKVEEKKAKPDFADIDGDGDKKETMKKAAKDKKEKANESVNEGMESDEVKAMFMSYPEDAEKVKATGQLDPDSQLYMDLFGYYQDEMPYGTQKARDGDPTEWLEMRLSDLGMMESTNEGSEYCTCGCDCDGKICESCGKPHRKSKKEATDLDRLRKLAGNEKVDEILPVAPIVGLAVKGAAKLAGKAIKHGAKAVASMADKHKQNNQ